MGITELPAEDSSRDNILPKAGASNMQYPAAVVGKAENAVTGKLRLPIKKATLVFPVWPFLSRVMKWCI